MNIKCTGRKVSLKESFEARVEKRMAKLDKFFSDSAEAGVTVTVEKEWQTVEVTVRDKGMIIRAEKQAPQMEEAFDSAAELLERRIIKNRKRMGMRTQVQMDFIESEEEEEPYQIIREKHFSAKPCMVEDAILEMEMLGHAFYLFRDGENDDVRLVYKRKDGTYGVLVPEQ